MLLKDMKIEIFRNCNKRKMRSRMKRTDQETERFKQEANNGCHSCNLSVASVLFIALALFHADLAPGAEGAGGSRNFANTNRNVPSSASSSAANKGLGAVSAETKPGIPRPGGADQQPSYKPMLVPDQLDADKVSENVLWIWFVRFTAP